MQSKMSILKKSKTLIKTLTLIPNSHKSISTFPISLNQHQHQQLLLALSPSPLPPSPSPSPLPPVDESPFPLPSSPSYGSPLYLQDWRNPNIDTNATPNANANAAFSTPSLTSDVDTLMTVFADWVTAQRWGEIKGVFEKWVESLDVNGKPNRPNVDLFNQYLRAHLMCGAMAVDMLEVVEKMEQYAVVPNTASYNLVIKSVNPVDWKAAVSLLERMLQSEKQSQPDAESFDLVIGMLFQQNQIEDALNYVDLTLKSGFMLSPKIFNGCVRSCVKPEKLDTLVSIIEKCKTMDQNKALSPSWNLCNTLAEVAIQNDNSKLTFIALGFMARWIQRGEKERPPIYLSVSEGLVVKSLSTAAHTYDSTLLDASWAILKRSLRVKALPNPVTYLAKINALASLGKLPVAFSTLSELEKKHGNSSVAAEEDLLSPFTSLHPLVVACSKKGFETLDVVYFQLENLSRADPPYKSVAALNCVILGCANIWDLDRAYQTFTAISSSFGLAPNIHSYNALMYAFGRLKKTQEATRVFEHLKSLGVKPNAMSYSLLVDAHLVNRDPKAALSVLEAMAEAGFEPSRATLGKVRRRCVREMDDESFGRVEAIARQCKIFLGTEQRRNLLFNLEYSTEFA